MSEENPKDFEDIGISDEFKERKNILINTTWLSPREAEVYVLYKEHPDYDHLNEVSDSLQLSEGAVYNYWSSIKDKIQKSRRTQEIEAQSVTGV